MTQPGEVPRFPTALGASDPDTITLLGQNLADDLMGKVGFGELALWLVTQRRPTAGEVRVFEAVLVALADHGFTPTAIAARLTYLSAPDSVQGALAAGLLSKLCIEHNLETEKLVVHSDNGAPMKGSTMLATMQSLGITPSFSRPSVSDDNAFAESLFRHLKYAPTYPRHGFATLDAARAWVARFVHWYNHEHLHSAIALVTPDDRHHGRDIAILEKRRSTYALAQQRNPRRWTTTLVAIVVPRTRRSTAPGAASIFFKILSRPTTIPSTRLL